MAVSHPPFAVLRRIHSLPGLLMACIAMLLPFVPLLSHRLDGLALISLPLALIAARVERDTMQKNRRHTAA